MQTYSAIALAYKISISEPTHESDDILKDLTVYTDKDWYRYDSWSCLFFTDLMEIVLNKFTYISTDTSKIYTGLPGAILRQPVELNTPYSGLTSINALIFSNVSLFLLTTKTSLRLIMFVDREYVDTYKTIPTPEMLIEFQLTGKIEFDEPSAEYFIDKNL
jgi:hypothetical protein